MSCYKTDMINSEKSDINDLSLIVNFQSKFHSGKKVELTLGINAKIMVWDNFASIKPLCGTEIVK